MKCRHCAAPLTRVFADLGHAPPSNSILTGEELRGPEVTYPLRILVCDECKLVQTEDYAAADEFFSPDYAYFSSTSKSWLEHARKYCEMIKERLGLDENSMVVEVASNDGYLLQNFKEWGIPCLGVEPTAGTAAVAKEKGIPTIVEFFGEELGKRLASEGKSADLICGNNVYAHIPDINDFTKGLSALLKPQGVVTLEFPHIMRLIEQNQFDTIYHEHYSYHTATTVAKIFEACGLRLFDVDELPTHGGSLRAYGCLPDADWETTQKVADLMAEEERRGLKGNEVYEAFQAQADAVKDGLLEFLLKIKKEGKTIAGYGAAAKGNTLLNYAGVRKDLLPFICDAAPSKQNHFNPGNHIPILPPKALEENRPDYIIILPWNIADEVMKQLSYLAEQGTKFVTAVPELRVR